MKKILVVSITLFLVSGIAFSQNPNQEFKKYSLKSLQKGMQFYVTGDYSPYFYLYKEKGVARYQISLEDYKNQILTFDRYEVKKPFGYGQKKRPFLVFNCNGVELMHDLYYSRTIYGLVFYDDIIRAKQLYLGKKYLRKEHLKGSNFQELFFYTITDITPNNTKKAMKVTYIAENGTSERTKEFVLSGTNNEDCRGGYFEDCYFEDYFLTQEEYLKEVAIIEEKKQKKKEESELYFKKREEERLAKIENNLNIQKEKCHYDKNGADEFTNVVKVFTDYYILTGEEYYFSAELSISLRKINNAKYIVFYSDNNLGCTSSYDTKPSYVKVRLQNGSIVTFYHRGDIDCSDFRLFGRITQNDIIKLKKSPIKSFRLSGTDYYHDVKSVFWDTFFIDKLGCIE